MRAHSVIYVKNPDIGLRMQENQPLYIPVFTIISAIRRIRSPLTPSELAYLAMLFIIFQVTHTARCAYIIFINIGARWIRFGPFGGEDSQHTGVGFVEVFQNIFATLDAFFVWNLMIFF